ncbi:DUF4097 family beta strand repeat-containing protein [Enterococcus sp. AZ109]|uniref:DUF4097 family beta strand repeat-containing protein n=1 Tax=Enterococcus sp. AZ109 TaxID=2774634 RepID=UPI003F286742
MKKLRAMSGCCLLFLLSGCGNDSKPKLVNTQELDQKFSQIAVDYDADDMSVGFHDEATIILKEYMNEDKEKYYASIEEDGQNLSITEGKRLRRASFQSYVEFILPTTYDQSLSIHTTSGEIDMLETKEILQELVLDTTSGKITVGESRAEFFRLTSTSGEIDGNQLAAKNLTVKSTSGSVAIAASDADDFQIETTSSSTELMELKGPITYLTKSGKLAASNLTGGGTFNATGEGEMELAYTKVNQDVTLIAKNGDLELSLPANTSCEINARTKDGKIQTDNFSELSGGKKEISGKLEVNPAHKVTLETRNGDIRLATD